MILRSRVVERLDNQQCPLCKQPLTDGTDTFWCDCTLCGLGFQFKRSTPGHAVLLVAETQPHRLPSGEELTDWLCDRTVTAIDGVVPHIEVISHNELIASAS